MNPLHNVRPGSDATTVPVIDSYGRLSRVPDTGELEKIATQLADNKNRIKHVGGQLGEEFSDGMSAWKAGVRRPDWEKMLERARLGLSHGICIWHTDRLFRKPRDLETLIELADKGFLIVSSHGVRDLSNPDDRFILRIEVAQAAKSSDDTARRVKRRFQSRREEGKSHDNARVFGFPGRQRRRKGETKAAIDAGIDLPALPEVTAEQVRAERAAIAKGAKDFLAGMTQSDIAAEWNAQGLRTTSGLTVTSMDIRQILAHARYAGLIEHQGEIVGEIADADPIFDEQTFYRIRAKIASRRRGALAGVKSVASGIMRCGQCGNPMYSRFGTRNAAGVKSRAYQCRRDRFAGCGRVAGTMAGIDAEIRRLVIQRLSDARFTAALTAARAAVADRLSEVNKEIAECEEVQTSLSVRLGRREIKQPAFDAANMPLVADLTALYAEREALLSGTPAEPVGLLHADDVARAWDAATIPQRSAMLRQAVGTDRLVLRRSVRKGGRGFDPSRVRLEPAPAPAPVTVPGSVAA